MYVYNRDLEEKMKINSTKGKKIGLTIKVLSLLTWIPYLLGSLLLKEDSVLTTLAGYFIIIFIFLIIWILRAIWIWFTDDTGEKDPWQWGWFMNDD